MKIIEESISGVYQIVLKPIHDTRGFFMRTYDAQLLKEMDIHRNWVQENHSKSEQTGTIRGLHFQFPPYSETKLVRCIRGKILDIFVDIRLGSKTFGQWGSIELSEDNKKMVYLPRGIAHGFCTLTEISEVVYKVDNFYSPENEGGLIWDDPDLKICWPTKNPVISDKDKKNYTLRDFKKKYNGI